VSSNAVFLWLSASIPTRAFLQRQEAHRPGRRPASAAARFLARYRELIADPDKLLV